MADTIFSVSQIADYLEKKLLLDPMLTKVSVRGEVTNFSFSSKGQAYFTIKDEGAQVSCIIFDTTIIDGGIDNGAMVVVSGEIGYYKRFGKVNLIVNRLSTKGKGDLYEAFLQTKAKLEDEGLFDATFKKALPRYPFTIGVITSAAGAAMHDIINVAQRRFPQISVKVYSAVVQGNDAPQSLMAGLSHFNKTKDVDLIIIGRGGGSFQDLFAFNDEALARAIFKSDVPVVSAVGHEVDFSIADFVADFRAPTPSAAAELCVPMMDDILGNIAYYRERFAATLSQTVVQKQADINDKKRVLERYSPAERLAQNKAKLDLTVSRLTARLETVFSGTKHALTEAKDKLTALSPAGVLSRGFAYITDDSGNAVNSAKRLKKGDAFTTTFADGKVAAKVTKTTSEEKQ